MFLLGSTLPSCAQASLAIVSNGKSTFAIVIPADAPTSVKDAAAELQKDIAISTGAQLALKEDTETVTNPIISLGNTKQANAAGFSTGNLADDTYRIVTQNGNLYILGTDTADDAWTKFGGKSAGTANGVYTFLEEYLGVRWLMPGDIGRDVPAKSTFTIGDIDQTKTPIFNYRYPHILRFWSDKTQAGASRMWEIHMRVGDDVSPVQLDYNHNWWRTINAGFGGTASGDVNSAAVKKAYSEHPEWFAMDDAGKRPYPKNIWSKLETTNPELVKWFAEQAIKSLKANEQNTTYSLSPSDGRGWSQSPESKALYDPAPPEIYDPEASSGHPSMSSLILKWYHDVATIVEKEYPQGRLAGYIYGDYIYPPQHYPMKLPDNFMPMIAPSFDYGYRLYRPEVQQRFQQVMDSWSKVAPKNWYYYDLPNLLLRQDEAHVGKNGNFPGTTGIVSPAAPDILNTVFSTLRKSHITGADIYGQYSWSNGAMANYMVAKLEWDPTLNADDVQKEWLHRAYGDKASTIMEQFYHSLNGWFKKYFLATQDVSHKVTYDMLQKVYAAHYPEMESLLLKAQQQPMTEKQKARLKLITDNMIVLQWRLRNAGFWPKDTTSQLQRTDKQVIDILTTYNENFPLFPGVVDSTKEPRRKPAPFNWKVRIGKATGKSTFTGLPNDTFVIYAAQDGDIRIDPQLVTQGALFASYTVQNQQGEIIKSGILNEGIPVTISAKAGNAYYLDIPIRKPVNYKLAVQNAKVAEGSFDGKTLTLSGPEALVYVYAPLRDTLSGVFDGDGNVIIRKPFSAMQAKAYMINSGYYTNVDILADLDEDWRFSTDPNNDGLQRGVEKSTFNDSSWKTVSALDWWQFQGFPDYHGVAWYRKKFTVDHLPEDKAIRLYFGAVDGNTEIYLNGEKVAEHKLDKNYRGWNSMFSTYVNRSIKTGENTLAVKVTSKSNNTASGMIKGVSLMAGTRTNKE